MAILTQPPKGTQDILPGESRRWQYVERTLLSVARLYGFEEIRTPTFEHTELFVRSVGDTTDVVQKEMYTFNDKKDRSITLKPRGTAGTVRAALEHGLAGGQLPIKACYITPLLRYESLRRAGCANFTSSAWRTSGRPAPPPMSRSSPWQTRRCAAGRHPHPADAQLHRFAPSAARTITPPCGAIWRATGRISAPPALQAGHQSHARHWTAKARSAPPSRPKRPRSSIFCAGTARTILPVSGASLKRWASPLRSTPPLCAVWNYYTRTVFEFVTDAIGAQGTVCGGGRYDGCLPPWAAPRCRAWASAWGWSACFGDGGLKRPLPRARPVRPLHRPDGKRGRRAGRRLCAGLRGEGFFAECDLMNRSVKAQMRYADKLGRLTAWCWVSRSCPRARRS